MKPEFSTVPRNKKSNRSVKITVGYLLVQPKKKKKKPWSDLTQRNGRTTYMAAPQQTELWYLQISRKASSTCVGPACSPALLPSQPPSSQRQHSQFAQ